MALLGFDPGPRCPRRRRGFTVDDTSAAIPGLNLFLILAASPWPLGILAFTIVLSPPPIRGELRDLAQIALQSRTKFQNLPENPTQNILTDAPFLFIRYCATARKSRNSLLARDMLIEPLGCVARHA
jgi:hypothetical protein